jgi:hypothetical protein
MVDAFSNEGEGRMILNKTCLNYDYIFAYLFLPASSIPIYFS